MLPKKKRLVGEMSFYETSFTAGKRKFTRLLFFRSTPDINSIDQSRSVFLRIKFPET